MKIRFSHSLIFAFVCLAIACQKEPVDNHEYVDLGLPSGTLWATMNLGAKQAQEVGGFYCWGHQQSTASWYRSDYKYFGPGQDTTILKYNTLPRYGKVDALVKLEECDDAATVAWGNEWCTPTIEQCIELMYQCNWEAGILNGVRGVYVRSKTNSNWIFFPAGGYGGDAHHGGSADIMMPGEIVLIMASTLDSRRPYYGNDMSFSFSQPVYLSKDYSDIMGYGWNPRVGSSNRFGGHNVRPVRKY